MTPAAREKCAQQREFIYEMVGFVRLYAELTQNFLVAGDDVGAAYSIEKMAVYVREVVKAKIELVEYRHEAPA